ncbi:unnamed protein product [Mycena citricolor]|uniref:Uncharacterized protein n=1 Tax=Mycena citricolor TaxID=2018698 RepID=A0AAD2K970_9AGAR|nr:unnamed protein product [Mycena citricolor]
MDWSETTFALPSDTEMLNPYAQDWNHPNGASAPPSVFGALPSVAKALPTFFTFRFTSFNPSIMNCTVMGPQATAYFRIITDTPMAGVSVFQNATGGTFSLVQWNQHPDVEIQGVAARQPTSSLLSLSHDRSYRSFTWADGSALLFVPRDNYIWIYYNSLEQILGRISRGRDWVTLELTGEALRLGLLETSVVATFLLQSGRNID